MGFQPFNTLRGSHKLGLRPNLCLRNLITFMQNSKQFINNEINGSIREYTANQLIQGTSPGFLFPWNRFVLAKIFIWISSDPEKISLPAELT